VTSLCYFLQLAAEQLLRFFANPLPSLAQAGLMAFQVLTLLVVANRLPGGVVAFQIALNFYYLAIAVGATPVALSLLPRLARMHLDGDEAASLVGGLVGP